MINDALFSSKNKDWNTPKWLFDELDKEYHFKLDACTSDDNPLGTEFFYTEEDNGLLRDWMNPTYCNPPYGRDVRKWVVKAYQECVFEDNVVVMLLPARTDTRWFQDFIYEKPYCSYKFLKGRLKFSNSDNSAPFPSMIVTFHG